MKRLDVSSYRKVNESFSKRMVYHVGVDCGLFVEINYMLDAMLYCLSHRIRFQMYSDDANFGTGVGWTEYFLPFCEEVHEDFHHKLNFHRPPSWPRIFKLCRHQKRIGPVAWKLKCMMKTAVGHLKAFLAYKECVLLGQDAPSIREQHYCIPELGIDGSYVEAYGTLARMVWNLHPEILRQESICRCGEGIPLVYDAIQIRGGDKDTEAELVSDSYVMRTLEPENGSCVFVLTDDYRLFQSLKTCYPQFRFVTLCQENETGYHHKEFCKWSPAEKKKSIVRLIISVDMLLHSRSFVGSITTGPSVFVMKQRADEPLVLAADCPKSEMVSALHYGVDVRAAISKRYMEGVRR